MAAGTQATPPGMTETSEEEELEAAEEVKGFIQVKAVGPRSDPRHSTEQGCQKSTTAVAWLLPDQAQL